MTGVDAQGVQVEALDVDAGGLLGVSDVDEDVMVSTWGSLYHTVFCALPTMRMTVGLQLVVLVLGNLFYSVSPAFSAA